MTAKRREARTCCWRRPDRKPAGNIRRFSDGFGHCRSQRDRLRFEQGLGARLRDGTRPRGLPRRRQRARRDSPRGDGGGDSRRDRRRSDRGGGRSRATRACAKRLLEACPAPDILVNNNGGPPRAEFEKITREQILNGIEANMLTPIALIQRVAPGMAERAIRAHRQHHFGLGARADRRPRRFLRRAGGPDRVSRQRGAALRQGQRHDQLDPAGHVRHRPGSRDGGGPSRRGGRRAGGARGDRARRAGWDRPRNSARCARSWRARTPATSPARMC